MLNINVGDSWRVLIILHMNKFDWWIQRMNGDEEKYLFEKNKQVRNTTLILVVNYYADVKSDWRHRVTVGSVSI